jgi:hypothetical protein
MKETRKDYDAIIIGGGQGGVTCGALLANQGKKVLLLEASDRLGGRWRSVEVDDFYVFAYGGAPVVQYGKQVIDKLGITVPTVPLVDPMMFFFNVDTGEGLGFPSTQKMKEDPGSVRRVMNKVLKLDGELLEDYTRVVAEMQTYSAEKMEELRRVSVADWVKSVTPNPLTQEFIYRTIYGYGSITIPRPEDMSTYTTIFEFMELMKEDIPLVAINDPKYPGTWGLPMAFAKAMLDKGGESQANMVVDKIIIEDGRAVGVTGMDRKYESRFEYRAPVVVSNLKIWENFNLGLLSPSDFPVDWYHQAMALERFKSGAITIWTATKRKLEALKDWHSWIRFLSEDDEEYTKNRGREICTHTYTRNRGGFGIQSAFCPSIAPPDKDLCSLTLWLTTEEIERGDLGKWVDGGHAALRQFFKHICKEDYDEIKLWNKIVYHEPSWGIEMYAVHPHPGVKSPTVEGLWFVGDSIDGKGIAGDHATYTGMDAAERIIDES